MVTATGEEHEFEWSDARMWPVEGDGMVSV